MFNFKQKMKWRIRHRGLYKYVVIVLVGCLVLISQPYGNSEYGEQGDVKPETASNMIAPQRKVVPHHSQTCKNSCKKAIDVTKWEKEVANFNLIKHLHPLSFQKPLEPVVVNTDWQVVNDPNMELYLYTAFYDDRPALDNNNAIRLLAIGELTNETLFCLLWYRNRESPDVMPVEVTVSGPPFSKRGKTFVSYILSCGVLPQRWPPEYVSIMTPETLVPATLVHVHQPLRSQLKKDLLICVPTAKGDFDPTKLVEWVEYNRLLGVDKIVVYNHSLRAEPARVIKHYSDKQYINYRQYRDPFIDKDNNTFAINHAIVLNDCLYRNVYNFKKIMVLYFDKMIVPRQDKHFIDMINYIDETRHINDALPKCYLFQHSYFYLDFNPVSDDPPFVMSTRYLSRLPPDPHGVLSRSIIDPRICISLSQNKCWKVAPKYQNTTWEVRLEENVSLVHHYTTCQDEHVSPATCKQYLDRLNIDYSMHKFINELSGLVAEKLWKLELMNVFDTYEERLDVDEETPDMKQLADQLDGTGDVSNLGSSNGEVYSAKPGNNNTYNNGNVQSIHDVLEKSKVKNAKIKIDSRLDKSQDRNKASSVKQ